MKYSELLTDLKVQFLTDTGFADEMLARRHSQLNYFHTDRTR